MKVRNSASTHAPTGRAASNHELAATTTERPSRTSAIPSRRCPGSMSRARPIERAAPPVPLGRPSARSARMARPQVSPAATSSDWLRRLAGLLDPLAGRRWSRGFGTRPAREVAFDLLVRVPERAAVLLAMRASVVAITSSTPPATLVTGRSPRRVGGPSVSRVTTGDKSCRHRTAAETPQEALACPSSSSPP